MSIPVCGSLWKTLDSVLVLSPLLSSSSHITSFGVIFYSSTVPHQVPPSHLTFSWQKSDVFTCESWKHLDLCPLRLFMLRFSPRSQASSHCREQELGGICRLRNELMGSLEREPQTLGLQQHQKPDLVLFRRKWRMRGVGYWDAASFICIFSKIWILLKCHRSWAGAKEYGIAVNIEEALWLLPVENVML